MRTAVSAHVSSHVFLPMLGGQAEWGQICHPIAGTVVYCTLHILKDLKGLLSEQGRDKTSGRGNTRDAMRIRAREEGSRWSQEGAQALELCNGSLGNGAGLGRVSGVKVSPGCGHKKPF